MLRPALVLHRRTDVHPAMDRSRCVEDGECGASVTSAGISSYCMCEGHMSLSTLVISATDSTNDNAAACRWWKSLLYRSTSSRSSIHSTPVG